jgi:hypothetical protein
VRVAVLEGSKVLAVEVNGGARLLDAGARSGPCLGIVVALAGDGAGVGVGAFFGDGPAGGVDVPVLSGSEIDASAASEFKGFGRAHIRFADWLGATPVVSEAAPGSDGVVARRAGVSGKRNL